MPTLIPVDHDPFADAGTAPSPAAGGTPPPGPQPGSPPASSAEAAGTAGRGPRLVPVDDDPFASTATAAGSTPPRGTLVLSPLPGEAQGGAVQAGGPPKPADESIPTVAADVAQSAGAGLIRGAAGMVDLPQTLAGLANAGTGWVAERISDAVRAGFGRAPITEERRAAMRAALAEIPNILKPQDLPRAGDAAVRGLEAATGKLYEPQTPAGRYARTAAEFVPGAGRRVADVLARGVIPGLASEGAGQITEGSSLETTARVAAPVLAGLAGAAFRAPSNASATVARRMDGTAPEHVDRAEALFQEAAARGLPLTRANAIDAVTNGATSLSDLQRVLEGNGRLRTFFAPTAGAVEREGRAALDTVAPASTAPAVLGGEVQQAARAGVAQTPEGMALAAAREAAGPRVTPEEAGQAIQPELRRVYEGREGMRAALAEQDYAAARAAPDRVGIDRTVTVERPGEPILQTRDPGPAAAPTFAPDGPPRTADLAPRRPDPVETGAGPAPKSLARFIAENGGIGLERGDVKAAGLDRWRKPGVAKLVREGGKSIDDFWRVKLIEEGYLPPDRDGGMSRNVHDEVLNALQEEAAGRPRFPIYAEQAADARSGFSVQRDAFEASVSRAGSDLEQALTRAGVDPRSVHPDIMDRATAALVRGDATDPLDAFERVVTASGLPPARPGAREIPTTITERIPAPVFGQVNPQPVVDHIDELLRTAKGPAAKALAAARETLFTRAGKGATPELDLSVAGLHNARDAIGDLIAKAEPAAQRTLLGIRDRLDGALSTAPEYEHARSGFEAASRAVDPFAEGTAPGRIVAKDPQTGRMTMPPERVPVALDEGSTGARAFADLASPEARRAYEGHLRTRLLDDATDATTGEVSAGKLREALRSNEDGLRPFPETRRHIERVAFAREGREAVDRSPLGKIAQRPVVQDAIDALFPAGAKGVSAAEVGQAVRRMAANNASAASELVRMHMGQVFDQATQRLQSGANQAGGAKFSAALVGQGAEAASMEAAVRALPGGDRRWEGIRRLLDIFDAQGRRQAVGSGTSFNDGIMADLKAGKPIGEAGAAIMTGGLKLPGRIMDKIEGWRMGQGLDEMARLFTDPKLAGEFRRLATQPQGGRGALLVAGRIVERGLRAYGSTQAANRPAEPEWKPLEFRPRAPEAVAGLAAASAGPPNAR